MVLLEDSLAAFERVVTGQKAPPARPGRARPKRETPSKERALEDLK
jgi:hypothetical protein